MDRLNSIRCLAFGAILLAASGAFSGRLHADYAEATVAELQAQMSAGALTSEALTKWYLDRIETIDWAGPNLRSVIEVNPDALEIARSMDSERNRLNLKGPLYGIPVVIKANIDTGDRMATSAASLALARHRAPDDAFLVRRLREAGAVIMGKANLSEWANFRSARSTSGWSSLGGQIRNPYDPKRNPCGSSGGSAVAVAANLTVLAVGTETDGSVVCPSGHNGIVGIKPSMGLISRDGIIPVAHSQDIAGPMARNVRDAALLLAVMAGEDASDPVTANAPALDLSFVERLSTAELAGKRVGVLRSYFGAGQNSQVEAVLEASIVAIRSQGAEIFDGIEIEFAGARDAEMEVLLYEFKADINRYLAESKAPYDSLAALIAFNEANASRVMPFFGQDRFQAAQARGPLSDPAYQEALKESRRIARGGLEKAFDEYDLDVLIAPTNGPAWLTDYVLGDRFEVGSSPYAAISGYPNVTVPAGFVEGLPVGLSFIGKMFSDEKLIGIAYAFEQATQIRRAPKLP